MMMPACEHCQSRRGFTLVSTYLDNEDDDGVLGVIFAGVFAFDDTALTCCPLICYTRSGSLCCYRRRDSGDDRARHRMDLFYRNGSRYVQVQLG